MKCLYVIMESIDIFHEKQANTDNLKLWIISDWHFQTLDLALGQTLTVDPGFN